MKIVNLGGKEVDSSLGIQLLLQVFLISLNAIFACAEIAIISINDNKLAKMAAQGDKRAVRLAILTSKPASFLATIQVAITLSGFMGSAFAAENFSDMLVSALVNMGVSLPVATLDGISVVVITLILSYFTLVFGELVPKRIAMKKAEQLGLAMSSLVTVIAKIFAPLVWLLTASTNVILRLIGIDPESEDQEITEEEIRMMVDVGSEKGAIDKEEKDFIERVFEFDSLTVGEIATHRKDVVLLWQEEDINRWDEIIHSTRHTLYPVCGDDIDDIIGVLNAKDYFRLTEKTKESVTTNCIRSAYLVPEGLGAHVLFRNMKQHKNHFAVVLDEYGGVYGIVTMNDLIQQLLGDEIDDEIEVKDIKKISDNLWEIDGSADLEEVSKLLDINIFSDEYDSFGGFVFGELGTIPKDGQGFELELEQILIKGTKIYNHRLEKSLVKKKEALKNQ